VGLGSGASRFVRSSSLSSGRDRFLDVAPVLALVTRVLGSDSSKPGVVPGVDLDGVESKMGVGLVPWVSGLNERRLKLRRAIVWRLFSDLPKRARRDTGSCRGYSRVLGLVSNNDA
jgi:hypothetical protein